MSDTLIQGNIKIEWDELGEGLCGDYDPDDPNDIELLRFTVYEMIDGEWEFVDDASYCTNVPVSAGPVERAKLLAILMDRIEPQMVAEGRCKKVCEELSWIGLDWLTAVVVGYNP
jgi:hypothetical protein